MESVMNFLADYYIWFFVAAGILCFALIGFIIESRKKQKSEFKGESIEESAAVNNTVSQPVVNTPVVPETTVETLTPAPETPVMSSEPQSVSQNIDNTMVINDIPLTNDSSLSNQTQAQFYNGPIEMPVNVPKPMPIETLQSEAVITGDNKQPEMTATIGEPISFGSIPTADVSQSSSAQNVEEQKNEQNFNIYEDFK